MENFSKPTGGAMSDADFEAALTALFNRYGIEEFAVYGRHAERGANGHYPHKLYFWNQGEQTVAEEAGYYLTRLSDQLKLEEMRRELRERRGDDTPVDTDTAKPTSFKA